jgi:hypothetical protein
MSDPFKLRAMGLLVGAGFVFGLFAQYQVPGKFLPPPAHGKDKKHQLVAEGDREDDDEGDPVAVPMGGSPKDPSAQAAAEAEAKARAEEEAKEAAEKAAAEAKRQAELKKHTPEIQSKYAAIAAVMNNSIRVKTQDGVLIYYFSSRGLSAEIDGDNSTVRIWKREDDKLCQQLDADRKECFTLTVRLDKAMQDGPADQIVGRIAGLAKGSRVGVVEGLPGGAELLSGNIAKFPDYVPLLDPNPNQTKKLAETLPGALLTRSHADEPTTATYFGPGGQVLDVTRAEGTNEIVRMWRGKWRMAGDRACRDLPPEGDGRSAQECSRVKIAGRSFEFPDAAASRRGYMRILGEEEARHSATEEASQAAEAEARAQAEARARGRRNEGSTLTLAPSSDTAAELAGQRKSSFTDLR